MASERTLVLVKPDGVQRGLVGPIITRLEQTGLKIIGLKIVQITDEMAAEHYAEHSERPFYAGLISFITSGPVVAMAVSGPNAVAHVRRLMGATNPQDAAPGTIRPPILDAIWSTAPQTLRTASANCQSSSQNPRSSATIAPMVPGSLSRRGTSNPTFGPRSLNSDYLPAAGPQAFQRVSLPGFAVEHVENYVTIVNQNPATVPCAFTM